MEIKYLNKNNPIHIDNTHNPEYGAMGRRIRPNSSDSQEAQYKQSLIPIKLDEGY